MADVIPGIRTSVRRFRLRKGTPYISLSIIVLLLVAGLAPSLFSHINPIAIDPIHGLEPPSFDGGSSHHLLGTDDAGRDIASRIVFGARSAIEIIAVTLVAGGGLGILVGLCAGYYGGFFDAFFMRVADACLAIPSILIALLVAAVSGPSFWLVVGAVSFVVWARFTRLVRGVALSLREREYIALARVAGRSDVGILFRHILPNALSSIMVLSTLEAGWIIIVSSSLSFLGAGVPPPAPSWGGMVSDGRPYLETAWWVAVCPAAAIAIVVLAFNTIGDWLRDVLDPRLRNVP